jgi:hypothetical protein
MPNLIKSNGDTTETEQEILNEVKNFYKNLYSARKITDINLKEHLNFNDIPKLSLDQSNSIEGKISKEEASFALSNMKNSKSPGSDGFTAEFFKFFWKDIGDFYIRSINYSFETNELSITQKEGVIICIPKGEKDKRLVKNWRPISLLNVSYKIASACIANRIKKFLPFLINDDQTGFISGRFIGENTRSLYDLFHFTEKNNIPGLLLLIDFEKAFDSLEWAFIYKTLDFFNFGRSIKKWLNAFYSNIKSCVQANGQISEWFSIKRGCRQGDPLSPYIFILCAEILALLIRKNDSITGIKIGNKEHLVSQYADDTSLTLDGTEKSLKNTLLVLKFYANASGLHINIEKTKVIWFGSMKGSNIEFQIGENLTWEKETFTVLGIKYSLNLKDIISINYNDKIEDIKSLLQQWSKRILTPYGKIIVIKTMALSKINHLLISLPNPSNKVIKELETLFFNFLWNNSPDKIKREIIIKQMSEGGLNMIELKSFIHSLKLGWIRRILHENKKWKNIFENSYPDICNFSKFGPDFIKNQLSRIDNPFWNEVFTSWLTFYQKVQIINWNEYLRQPIWFNPTVKVGGTTIFYNNLFQNGITFVADLIDNNGQFYSLQTIQNILQININFLLYEGLLRALINLRVKLKINNETSNTYKPIIPKQIQVIVQNVKGCHSIYEKLVKNKKVPKSQDKWKHELSLPENFEWNKVYTTINKITSDTNLRYFQYKLINRILATNTFLTKIGIKDNNTCTFCRERNETLLHLFYECRYVSHFWRNLKIFIKTKCPNIADYELSKEEILFGITDPKKTDETLNFIFLIAKRYIYTCRYNNQNFNIQTFHKTLVFHYNVEKYIQYSSCDWDKFNSRWSPFQTLVDVPN